MNIKQKINEDADGIFTAAFVTIILLMCAAGALIALTEEMLTTSNMF